MWLILFLGLLVILSKLFGKSVKCLLRVFLVITIVYFLLKGIIFLVLLIMGIWIVGEIMSNF